MVVVLVVLVAVVVVMAMTEGVVVIGGRGSCRRASRRDCDEEPTLLL